MFSFDATMEDVQITAVAAVKPQTQEWIWHLECVDLLGGETFIVDLTLDQMQLFMGLVFTATGVDDTLGGRHDGAVQYFEELAYEVLEPLFKECPLECRPFP